MNTLIFQTINSASNDLGVSTTNPELVIRNMAQIKVPNRTICSRNIVNSMTLSSQERHLFQFPSLNVIDIARIATTPPDPHTF
ncbi:Uncharacterised protein [Legionella wadsworthii]|uniref:Uncharacterized protein n=1 Tax=Legionella wadsworthii TaxID=28088 RepID=A0A378LSU5_9GAMM|nr:Uncharacterised protein [Legionella wadsworthii]